MTVVDGQQRLTAIFEFFDDDLDLGKRATKEFGGPYYTDLPQERQDAFDDYEIEFDVIDEASEPEVKEYFQRLQDGLPLTSSEKLNSVHSNLRDFARELARHNFFTSKVRLADKRYSHFDIAAKVAAIELEGIETGLRFDDLKRVFRAHEGFSRRSAVAQRLRSTFDYLDRVFPTKSEGLRHRALIQAFATLVARLVQTGRADGYEKKLAKFFEEFTRELSRQVELGPDATDLDYLRFQRTVNANVRGNAQIRQEILLRKLFQFDPGVAQIFHPSVVAESGVGKAIKETADSVTGLVHDINSAFAAANGHDLFKPTTKTSRALTRLAKPVETEKQYGAFVDDLYFLFHEGRGTRLDGQVPESFNDINALRTALRHDVDHGSPGKAKAKMKRLGAVFAKYAGVRSPETADPSSFTLAQANLLAALEGDLRQIRSAVEAKPTARR